MKLWLLRPGPDDSAWKPWYDKCFGFVVRAETEEDARQIGSDHASDEKCEASFRQHSQESMNPWNDPLQSTCVELLPDGPAELVIKDLHAA